MNSSSEEHGRAAEKSRKKLLRSIVPGDAACCVSIEIDTLCDPPPLLASAAPLFHLCEYN